MYRNNKLAKSVRLALVFGASATAFAGAAVAQEQTEAGAERVERIQVTGSRLNRTDMEGALPVTVISREDLDASGDISVADYMRDTNFNAFGSYQSGSGSSFSGASQISLRGLGAGRTLILIDGRRTPTSPITGGGQDLNSIPMAAVERIEVLSDGASAVYGSDAIGGVVNIITRRDYEGVEATYGRGFPTNDGGDTEEASVLIGASTANGRVLFGASFNSRDVIFTRDRDYWYNPDNPGVSTFSNNFSRMLDSGEVDGNGNPIMVHASQLGEDGRLRHPEYGAAVPGLCTNGDQSDLFYLTGSGADATCQYDHAATSANLTSLKNISMFGRGDYEINNNWSVYFNAGLNKVESFGRYAALPSSPWAGGAIQIDAGSPNHPGTAPEDGGLNPNWDDPYYQDLAGENLSLYHRFAALGPRDNNVENTTLDFDGGFKGFVGDFAVEIGARHVNSRAINLGQNYVVAGLAQPLISDGTYNIYDPFDGDPASAGLTTTTSRDMFSKVKEFYANAAFDLWDMAGGAVSAAVGAEYREEDYQNQYDLLSAAGQVSGSSGSSSGGSRDVTAAFGEILFPVLDTLDIELAGRFDDYSDYGSDFSPKIAANWRPTNELSFRASYGQGFRAPTLSQVTQAPSFSATFTNDEATCIALTGDLCSSSIQVNTYTISNPDLGSEESEQFGLGLVWEAAEWINLTLDYYNIEITDSISSVSLATAVGCLRGTTSVCPAGISQFANTTQYPDPAMGVGVSFAGDDIDGAITGAQLGFVNLGSVETDGFDLNVNTNFDFGWGQLRNNFNGSYVRHYEVNGNGNAIGEDGLPQIRATLSNTLVVEDFNISWNISHIDSMSDTTTGGADYRIPSWTTHNLQVAYQAPWNATLAIGVTNLFDKDPADAALFATSYNSDLYSPWGRVPYFRYTQRF